MEGIPLFQQSVEMNMLKFHAHFATLELRCSMCSEGSPSLHFHPGSTEFVHCRRDKCMYSNGNNRDPGPIPQYNCR